MECGPDLTPAPPEEPAKLYLPPQVAKEREEKRCAALPKVAHITIPVKDLLSHLDDPDWAAGTLALAKQKLAEQGVVEGDVQIHIADYKTLNLPPEAMSKLARVIEDGQPPPSVRANWARGYRRRLKAKKRKR